MEKNEVFLPEGKIHTSDYLKRIGVPEIAPATSPFDPGYDPVTLESHLDQSSHLMSILKISMACWMVANERATRRKIAAAKRDPGRPHRYGWPSSECMLQFPLGHRDFKRATARNGRHAIALGGGDLRRVTFSLATIQQTIEIFRMDIRWEL